MLIVQQIRTTWYARHRAIEPARLRAEVPLALDVFVESDDSEYSYDKYLAEPPSFGLEHLRHVEGPKRPWKDDYLRYEDGIVFRAGQVGAPYRLDVPVDLEGRRWIRLRVNGRSLSEPHYEFSTWVYEEVVLNIGDFESVPHPGVFRTEKPSHEIDLRRTLR